MRKLTPDEERALELLRKHGSFCPDTDMTREGEKTFVNILQNLVRKKRVWTEATDAGFRYHPL